MKNMTAFGKTQNLSAWSREYDIPYWIIYNRLRNGLTLEESLSKTYTPYNALYEAFGEKKTINQWIEDERCKIKNRETLRSRILAGDLPFEDIIREDLKKIKADKYIGKKYDNFIIKSIYRENKRTFVDCECLFCHNLIRLRWQSLRKYKNMSCGCSRYRTGDKNPKWRGYKDIGKSVIGDIRKSAKKRGIEFNLNIEYLWDLFVKQDKKCALSGKILNFASSRRNKDCTASLDRIDSSKGYIEGNVQWVYKDINLMKRSLSDDEFINLCFLICKHKKIINEEFYQKTHQILPKVLEC